MSDLYQFSAMDINGEEYRFEGLKGNVVLIVNTASKCGFTPQYEGLQRLHEKYHDRGLVILGFPTNDFLFQEPGNNEEIKNFCQLNYGVDFKLFGKISVRGKNAHPVYKYLVEGAGNKKFRGFIKWNFTKFLFDREGHLIERVSPTTQPEKMEETILSLL